MDTATKPSYIWASGNVVEEEAERVRELMALLWDVFPHNIRTYIHKISATELPKYELINDDTNWHAKVDREKPIRPELYTKNYRQLRKARSMRGRLPWRRAYQLFVHCQKVIPETIHTRNIIQCMFFVHILYMFICMCVCGLWRWFPWYTQVRLIISCPLNVCDLS